MTGGCRFSWAVARGGWLGGAHKGGRQAQASGSGVGVGGHHLPSAKPWAVVQGGVVGAWPGEGPRKVAAAPLWGRCSTMANPFTLPHTTPPPECLRFLTPFVGRGAMGSHLRVVRPGGPSRLREWLGHSRSREGSLGAPRRAPAASQSLRALWGGRARPACRPLLPNSGRRAGFQRKTPWYRQDTDPATLRVCWLGRSWGLDDIKGFSRGNHDQIYPLKRDKLRVFCASFLVAQVSA